MARFGEIGVVRPAARPQLLDCPNRTSPGLGSAAWRSHLINLMLELLQVPWAIRYGLSAVGHQPPIARRRPPACCWLMSYEGLPKKVGGPALGP